MNELEKDLLKKISHLSRISKISLEAIKLLRTDHHKRLYSRSIYIFLDSFFVHARRLKNSVHSSGLIHKGKKNSLESSLDQLEKDYRGVYESIRDKLTAHHQQETIDNLLDNWNEVNLLSVDVFVDDMLKWVKSLEGDLKFRVEDILHGDLPNLIEDFYRDHPVLTGVSLSNDSLALTKDQTVGMIACHPDQEKAMAINSTLGFLDFLTRFSNYTKINNLLHLSTWSLLIVDFFSVLDNLYDDSRYESLLTKWKNGNYKGYSLLRSMHDYRDVTLEQSARELRNKFCAHIDSTILFKDLIELIWKFDLEGFAQYMFKHMDNYFLACRQDIRTTGFGMLDTTLKGVISVQEVKIKKFDE